MLEEYLQVQGREWERFAWLKSRVVAPRASVTSGRALALRSLVTAFVYRRYLDYGVFEGLRQLHRKIREEAQRRAAGRPERANDVKLSRGGIREIEFIVQLMLVVRGGQFPEIRTRSTLRGLQRLSERGLMKPRRRPSWPRPMSSCARWSTASSTWTTSRPTCCPPATATCAGSPQHGPGLRAEACELLTRLGEVRELVAAEFDALLHDGQARPATTRQPCKHLRHRPAAGGQREPARTPAAGAGHAAAQLGAAAARAGPARREPPAPGPPDAEDRAGAAEELFEAGALRFIDWVEPLLRRESYLALLVERSEVHAPAAACAGCWHAGPCST
jgi:glutamate-ammonia-ligase adenylyltransferase